MGEPAFSATCGVLDRGVAQDKSFGWAERFTYALA